MDRALLFLYPGCVYREVADALDALVGRLHVDVCAAEPSCVRVAEGIEIRATLSRTDARSRSYRVVLVPGGDVFEPLHDAAGLRALAAIAGVEGTIVAAICNGVVVVGAAGLLAGRRATHTVRPPGATPQHVEVLGPHVAAAQFVGDDLVVDGSLITAKPWASAEFARAIVAALGGRARESRNSENE